MWTVLVTLIEEKYVDADLIAQLQMAQIGSVGLLAKKQAYRMC